MNRYLLFGLCLFPLFLSAQTPFDPLGNSTEVALAGEKQIRIQVEWIEVSHEQLTTLMRADRRLRPEGMLSSNEQPLRDAVDELIKKGESKIVETAMVIARSGNRAKAESVLEFVYPTEYDPPSKTTTRTIPGRSESDKSTVETTRTPGSSFPLATAFEIRNVGATLEVDPILGADNRTIDLNLAPELVYQCGFENYGKYDRDGSETEIRMAKFYTAKVTTQITLIDGQYLMAAVVSPRDVRTGEPDPSRKLMLFVKADILVCGLPIEKKKK